MTKQEINTFCPANRQHWRDWLLKNHACEKSVWLIYYKKNENGRVLSWSDAVDEALCFGWIDSLSKPLDKERYMQLFTPRKPNSVWSTINKAKVERLIREGLMMPSGFDAIDRAKSNASWTILDAVENLIIPDDLQNELSGNPEAERFFLALSKSDRRTLLQWLVLAKRPETRQKRIRELVECAEQHNKPQLFRRKKTAS